MQISPREARWRQIGNSLSSWLTQRSPAASLPAEFIEDFVAAIDFQLMNHLQQLTQAPFRKAVVGKPREVFDRQIVERHAARRKMIGTEFTERHEGPADLLQVDRHPMAQPVFELGIGIGHDVGGSDYFAADGALNLMERKASSSP